MERVLFICTGNTCRSPMAEAIFEHKKASDVLEARSAGIHGMEGIPISENSKTVLARRGILESHQSKTLTAELVRWADVVLTMTESHKRDVIEQYPNLSVDVYTLKEFALGDEEYSQKFEDLKHHTAQLELKRASFIAENQDKIDKYNEKKSMNNQKSFEEELLEIIYPHQKAIDEISAELPSLDISDPFGTDHQVYEKTYQEIERAIEHLLRKLENGQKG